MPKSQVKMTEELIDKHEHENEDLKGTFVSVMLLGGFIVLSWVGVWILYLIR